MYENQDIQHCIGEWEPGSANHTSFYNARADGARPIEAVQSTWTYQQYALHGFGNIRDIGSISTNGERQSPYGHPDHLVYVMFERES